ncbi:MAG: hypothetical protein DSY35_05265 [Desulfurobacterium sp.]|nr:MAG: hypothetical protein DSY35_05265 [Desulfurobacterium sp.]
MEAIKNLTKVEDQDFAKAISPFAPTYQKAMIIEISPTPKSIVELVNLEQTLQEKVGEKVGISLV